jgi:hypothetical protein
MNAPLSNLAGVDIVEVFTLRAEALARLYADGEIDLHIAVDELQQADEAYGLIAAIGQDAVQAIMSEAFAAVGDDLPDAEPITDRCSAAEHRSPPADQYEGLSSTFAAACRAADEKQRRKPHDPRIERARALMDDDVSLERVWCELNSTPGRAASSTVEALMHSLRQRGTAALKEEPATRRRLGELSDDQLAEVGTRLQRLKPVIARAWTAGEVETLMKLRESLR